MAIVPRPGSAPVDEGEHADYAADHAPVRAPVPSAAPGAEHATGHATERPEDWGWHGEWGKWARIGGWLFVFLLIVMATSTQYNAAGSISLFSFAGLTAIALIWDVHRRRTSWRK